MTASPLADLLLRQEAGSHIQARFFVLGLAALLVHAVNNADAGVVAFDRDDLGAVLRDAGLFGVAGVHLALEVVGTAHPFHLAVALLRLFGFLLSALNIRFL